MHLELYQRLHQQKDRHHHLHHLILRHPRLERIHFATNSYGNMIHDRLERECGILNATFTDGSHLP